MPMPGKGKGKRNRGQCLTLINEGNCTRTFILQCEFFFTSCFLNWLCNWDNLLDLYWILWFFFKHESYGTFNFPRSYLFPFGKGGYFGIFPYFSSFYSQWDRHSRAWETEVNQRAFYCFPPQVLALVLSDHCWCFSLLLLPFFFGEGRCPLVLNVWGIDLTHRAHLAERVWLYLGASSSEYSKAEDVMCPLPPQGA